MAWDSERPVPWKRLLIEWLVVGTIMAMFSLVFTDNRKLESYVAILLGGVVYLTVGGVLAKFGYARTTLRQLRAQAKAAPARAAATSSTTTGRAKPAATKRTSTGPGRPSQKRHR